jgi:hypothetical protein
MAESHSTVWQTASSTHWQYPPKRYLPATIVRAVLSDRRTGRQYSRERIPIRERVDWQAEKRRRPKPRHKKIRADPCKSVASPELRP